jgi:hypothetical protein
VNHRAGLRTFFVDDGVHVNNFCVGRIDFAFNQFAVEIEQREILGFKIVE